MKALITILFSIFLIGCGAKFMDFLNSTGDAFVEGVELGKEAKAIMFECDFKDKCFFERLDDLLYERCQTPEKYDMVSYRECEAVFRKQLEQAYKANKQIMGK